MNLDFSTLTQVQIKSWNKFILRPHCVFHWKIPKKYELIGWLNNFKTKEVVIKFKCIYVGFLSNLKVK